MKSLQPFVHDCLNFFKKIEKDWPLKCKFPTKVTQNESIGAVLQNLDQKRTIYSQETPKLANFTSEQPPPSEIDSNVEQGSFHCLKIISRNTGIPLVHDREEFNAQFRAKISRNWAWIFSKSQNSQTILDKRSVDFSKIPQKC